MIKNLSPKSYAGYAPAKLNLFFEIQEKRPDGYHDVCSLCCPVGLFDTILWESQESPEIVLECQSGKTGKILTEIPTNSDNLVVKAVEAVRKRCGISTGCRLRLLKRIPSQAGMGGGSSDAAIAIRLADHAWGLQLSRDEMIAIGSEIGSDVPLFFMNGMSLGYGRGEQLEAIKTNVRLDFVIVKPSEGISTAEAFRKCTPEQYINRRTPEQLVRGLHEGNMKRIASGMFNRLETTARTMSGQVRGLAEKFSWLDCAAHQMTGSGTAYFALCRHDKHARQLANRLRSLCVGDVFVVNSLADANSLG